MCAEFVACESDLGLGRRRTETGRYRKTAGRENPASEALPRRSSLVAKVFTNAVLRGAERISSPSRTFRHTVNWQLATPLPWCNECRYIEARASVRQNSVKRTLPEGTPATTR